MEWMPRIKVVISAFFLFAAGRQMCRLCDLCDISMTEGLLR